MFAQVLVFILACPLLDRFGVRGAAVLAAAPGIARWSVASVTTSVLLLSLIQPLHGLTFVLLHPACMRMMGVLVAASDAATAQALCLWLRGANGSTDLLVRPPLGAVSDEENPNSSRAPAFTRVR
ncbi:MFS transporter [Bradyrhizobium sp. 25ACV]